MLAEEMKKHPNLTKRILDATDSNDTKRNLIVHGNVVESITQADTSFMRSKVISKIYANILAVNWGEYSS